MRKLEKRDDVTYRFFREKVKTKGYHISATIFSGSTAASEGLLRVHLFSISSAAFGWSMGTMCPASCTCLHSQDALDHQLEHIEGCHPRRY